MHKLLLQQLEHFVGDCASLPPQWSKLIDVVNGIYENSDSHRGAMERSVRELRQRNAELELKLVERQHAEAQLEHLLSLLGTTLESTADGILVVDRDGRIVRFNQRFVEMWRIPDPMLAFWKHDQVMEQVLGQLNEPAAFLQKLEYMHDHPEDESHAVFACTDGRIIELYALPRPDGVNTVGRVLSFRDITVRQRMEAVLRKEKEEQQALIRKLEKTHNQLLQSEKMASIGQLSAGIAHEINNPIGFVNSNLSTLKTYVENLLAMLAAYETSEPLLTTGMREGIAALRDEIDLDYLKRDIGDLLKESQEGTQRVMRIVQDLKDFSHVDSEEWQWTDLHRGLDSTLNIVNNEIKYKTEVIREYGEIPRVQCLGHQLNQVFMNLLVNAAQAIEDRGVITIRTGVANEEAWIEIADTGKGIAPENLKRIFDPFFTTKPVGKGTGLGLALSYSIVEKHHGRLEVESEVGRGTTFRIRLPLRHREDMRESARAA